MVGWHHRINGREFEQAPGVGGGQGSLACYSTLGCKESVTTEDLNYNRTTSIYWVASIGEILWITWWMSGINMCVCVSSITSVMSDSVRPQGLEPARLLCPWGQTRILEWVARPSSRGSSRPRDRTRVSYVSCFSRWVLYHQCFLERPQLVKSNYFWRLFYFDSIYMTISINTSLKSF